MIRDSQRAFRERKERHVRDLENKVTGLEGESTSLKVDNERLRQELARVATENKILRATTQTGHNINNQPQNTSTPRESEPTTTGPMTYRPLDLSSSPNLAANRESKHLHQVTVCPITGEKLLDTGATWDLLQGHELVKCGEVNIENVSRRLRNMAQCNGQGPAFREGEVRRAIKESAVDRMGS